MLLAESAKRCCASKWPFRLFKGKKKSSGAGCRLQGDLQYGEDPYTLANQRTWQMPKNRADGRCGQMAGELMTQLSPKRAQL